MTKEIQFQRLISEVSQCQVCERMEGRTRVLGANCGRLDSTILFIGEAPGRFGADRSGIPFTGDQAGNNFNDLIANIGWNRGMFFITNAVLCNPRDESGNNAKPKDSEINRCSRYLSATIRIIQPQIIVTLGENALKALSYVLHHNIILKTHVATPQRWDQYIVFPLYHCSPKAFIHRKKELQMKDYIALGDYCREFVFGSQVGPTII